MLIMHRKTTKGQGSNLKVSSNRPHFWQDLGSHLYSVHTSNPSDFTVDHLFFSQKKEKERKRKRKRKTNQGIILGVELNETTRSEILRETRHPRHWVGHERAIARVQGRTIKALYVACRYCCPTVHHARDRLIGGRHVTVLVMEMNRLTRNNEANSQLRRRERRLDFQNNAPWLESHVRPSNFSTDYAIDVIMPR